MNQPSPPRSPSGRKSNTPNHPHSLDSRNGFPAKVGTARILSRRAGPRHSGLAVPGIIGAGRVSAAQLWHCQGFLACGGSSPAISGTARDSWRPEGPRHPALALPGIPGIPRALATQLWHCQGFLARGGFPPLLHIPVSDWHVTDLAIASIIVAMQDRRRRAAHGAVRSDAQLND